MLRWLWQEIAMCSSVLVKTLLCPVYSKVFRWLVCIECRVSSFHLDSNRCTSKKYMLSLLGILSAILKDEIDHSRERGKILVVSPGEK